LGEGVPVWVVPEGAAHVIVGDGPIVLQTIAGIHEASHVIRVAIATDVKPVRVHVSLRLAPIHSNVQVAQGHLVLFAR